MRLKSIVRIPKWLADLGLKLNRLYYKQRLESIYYGPNPPAWFDHRIDLYYHWPRNLFWVERGVFPRKYMFKGCKVLDLFCGDGFFSYYFYSTIADEIDALDLDPQAIAHAKKWHANPKITYYVSNVVLNDLPKARYDVVVWYEGIEHLSREAMRL